MPQYINVETAKADPDALNRQALHDFELGTKAREDHSCQPEQRAPDAGDLEALHHAIRNSTIASRTVSRKYSSASLALALYFIVTYPTA